MKNEEYLSRVGKRKINRIMAWIGLVLILCAVIATIVTGITGSKYFIPCLASCFVVTLLTYAMLFIGKVFSDIGESIDRKNDVDSQAGRNSDSEDYNDEV